MRRDEPVNADGRGIMGRDTALAAAPNRLTPAPERIVAVTRHQAIQCYALALVWREAAAASAGRFDEVALLGGTLRRLVEPLAVEEERFLVDQMAEIRVAVYRAARGEGRP